MSSPPTSSARAKRGRRPTGGVGVEAVHEAGRGLGATLFVAPALGGGGDVEPVEVPAGEGAGGALSRRQCSSSRSTPSGSSDELSAAVDATQMSPSASTVNPSGVPTCSATVTNTRPLRWCPSAGRSRMREQARSAIGQIHGGAVGTPSQSIGNSQFVQHQLHTSVAVEAVEAPPPGRKSSASVPAQNRPCGSQAPSFIRVPVGATSRWAAASRRGKGG